MESLAQLLNRCRSDGSRYTHVGYFGPKCYYNLTPADIGQLWHLYCREGAGADLGERITECAPVRVDLTLVFEEELDEPYEDDFIMSLVRCYQQAAHSLFTTTSFGARYCCVLQPDDLGQLQDGRFVCHLALHFPFLRITPQQHLSILRKEAIKALRSSRAISLLPQQPIGDWDDIIGRPTDVLPFYRSRRSPSEPILTLTRIYDWVYDEHIEAGEGPEREISEVFTPRMHSLVRRGLLEVDEDESWLPLLMSIDYDDRVATTTIASPDEEIRPSVEETELDLAQRFLLMLRIARLVEDHTWIDIGKCLYNISGGGEDGLDVWKKLAKQAGRPISDCDRYVEFKVDNHMTIKTLAWFAKQDNPQEYTRWHREWCIVAMELALEGTHTDVARALYRYFWLDYVCSRSRENLWYVFDNHSWREDDDATSLKSGISREFVHQFEIIRTITSQEIQESSDANFKRGKEELLKKIGKLIRSLKSVTFKTSLVREAKESFYHRTFSDIIDTDPALLGVQNGVIQLTPTYAIFRPGKPEDFVTRKSLISYDPNLTLSSPEVIRLNEWFGQMFPDKELHSYALRLFSSCLYGKNSNKIFPVLTGCGDNSKSMLKKLFEATLGPSYCATVPNSLLTGRKTSSSSPSPELAQLMGSRIAFVQEPDGDDTIKGGVVKELTGGDSFFARFLHKNGGPVVASFTLMLLCNKIPIIPTADQAVMNRLRVLPFLSTWSDDAPLDRQEQYRQRRFPKDPNFEARIPKMAPAFLWTLVREYGNYTKMGLAKPQIIHDHTENYWQENLPINVFIREMIEEAYIPGREPAEVPDPNDPSRTLVDKTKAIRDKDQFITWREVYSSYKRWFQDSNPGVKVPSQAASKPEFVRRLGPLTARSQWLAYRFKELVGEMTPVNHSGL